MLDDDAVLIAGTGAIWTGTVGTAPKPTLAQLLTYVTAGTTPSGWANLGHTSDEDLPSPDQEDGETETKNTWQAKPLRTTTTPGTDFWDVTSLQLMDNDVLKLYYGGGDASVENEFALPDSPSALERAVTMVMIDGSEPIAFYAPKMSIYRQGPLTFDSGEFATVPLRFTLLKLTGAKKGIWIGDRFGLAA